MGVRQPIEGVVYPPDGDLARYLAAGLFGPDTMGEAFTRVARRFPGRVAIFDGSPFTFAELDALTERVAAGLLDIGLRPLDRATFQVANGRQLVVAMLACMKAGLIPVCTLTAHRRTEIAYLSRHAAARAHFICTDDPKFDFLSFSREMRELVPTLEHTVVCRGDCPDDVPGCVSLEGLAERGSDDASLARLAEVDRDPFQVAVFQLSGGTSGIPKIIPRFHNEYLYQLNQVADWQGLDENTVAFAPTPMMHNAPIVVYWGCVLWRGGEVITNASLDVSALAAAVARGPTWTALPLPLVLNLKNAGLLDRDVLGRARMVAPNHTVRLGGLTGAEVFPLYGMTEGIIVLGRRGDPDVVLREMIGRAVSPFDEFRILDVDTREALPPGSVGEFCFKGPSSCRGYFDAPERNVEAFTADGFCLSGDLMREHVIDGLSYLSFEGRVKDVVSRGGEKINCQEVERALIDHPAIGAIAIVPMPDEVFGEKACAFVIPARDAVPPSVKEVGAFLEEAGLAKFKWPERIERLTEFPMTSSGKVSKPRLREMITQTLQDEAVRAAVG